MSLTSSLKKWLKTSEHPLAIRVFKFAKAIRYYSGPNLPSIYRVIWSIHHNIKNLFHEFVRIFYYTPMLKSQLKEAPKSLYLYGGMPLIIGNVDIVIDEGSRISGATTFSGRTSTQQTPLLKIGKNVDIGWQTGISVGSRVVIGDNTRISGRAYLAGYPGHPLDAKRRALGEPEDDNQVGDIILENDVWLATGVSVMAGVTIGQGTIVATGSVVTKDLPPHVLAGGIPAKVIRHITENEDAQCK